MIIFFLWYLITQQILEFVRDGDKTVAELMDIGKQILGR